MTNRPASREPGRLPRPEDRAVYIISVAAELAGVHPQTLRIYERKGLLHPARTAGNTRRYSERDIQRLQTIQRLTQEEGLNLAGVRMIVEMEDQLDRMRRRVEAMDRELQRARARMEAELERLHRQYFDRSTGEIVPFSQTRTWRLRPAASNEYDDSDDENSKGDRWT
jgi:MerR family transcriptional regulator, heat shock protein HspR